MTPRDEQITTLFHSGLSQRAIAKAVGISQPAIHKRLHRLGLVSSPSDNLTVASHDGEHDNQGQGRTSPDNLPGSKAVASESPSLDVQTNVFFHPTQQTTDRNERLAKAYGGTDNLSRTTLPPGAISCGVCKGAFKPQSPGQKYCCNACGAKAAGYKPVVEHSERCLLLRPIEGDNHTTPVEKANV